MKETSHERALIGLGIDVGGSGVRTTAFVRDDQTGLLDLLDTRETKHARRGLASSIADCLTELLTSRQIDQRRTDKVLVGIATPGSKTADGRGIASARNLGKAPALLDDLARELDARQCHSVLVNSRLSSDADAALFGETVVLGGALIGVREALFLGLGSGLAEALLRDGAVRAPDGVRTAELPPTVDDGEFDDLEDEVSLQGLTRSWRAHCMLRDPDEQPVAVEVAADRGDPVARERLERLAIALARVIELRLDAFHAHEQSSDQGKHAPAVLVRSRRGAFFASTAVRALVVPPLLAAAKRRGAVFVLPSKPLCPYSGCAGALALALRARTDNHFARH